MKIEDRWLALVPRDTMFVRDGRSFDAGSDAVAHTVTPGPSTVAGAVGAAFRGEIGEVRGPVLARWAQGAWWPHYPAPLDLVVENRRVHRLRPAEIEGSTDLSDDMAWLEPPAAVGRVEQLPGLLSAAAMTGYLAGTWPRGTRPRGGECVAPPMRPETRVGLARDGRTARTGFLYRSVHLRPDDGWALLAGCVLKDQDQHASGPVQLGGRGRLVDVEDAGPLTWPGHPDVFPDGRLLLYLATPAVWPDGWRPPLPARTTLVAAATGEPQAVATMTPGLGWKASRALRWAVPAGSVYLLRFPDEASAGQFARYWHGCAWEQAEDRLRTAGFGVVLTGVWA